MPGRSSKSKGSSRSKNDSAVRTTLTTIAVLATCAIIGIVIYLCVRNDSPGHHPRPPHPRPPHPRPPHPRPPHPRPPHHNHQIGGQTDKHGCLKGAGESWCHNQQRCVSPHEEC